MSCPICCADFNKSTRAPVTCYFPSCSYTGCKECIRTYLTSVAADPHCMNCRNRWNLEFIKNSLNAVFIENDYRNHRKTILADRAIAQIPEYYEGALRHAHKSEGDLKIAEIQKTIREHNEIISKLSEERDRIRREMNENPTGGGARKFVMQCQNNGCRGMLTTQYKCDLCTKFTCSKCFVAIEGEKADHVCKQEDVDTVEELRKNSRPCPTCGTRISKIDGCDQMWCPECKTAFSWSKGTVEKGVIHNPHYYQWMREHGGGMPRNPQDHNNDCGNMFYGAARRIHQIVEDCMQARKCYENFVNYCRKNYVSMSKVKPLLETATAMLTNTGENRIKCRLGDAFFSGFHRYINHMEQTELRPLRTAIQDRDNNKTHIYEYILNEIDKERLSNELIRLDTLNMKDRALSDIYEALVVVGKQMVLDCLRELEEELKKYSSPLNLSNRFDNDRRFVSEGERDEKHYATMMTYYVMHLPQESEALQNGIFAILQKYQAAIRKYCAYSNMEFIKYLMTYSSKKMLTAWDSTKRSVERHLFASKGEMVRTLNEFKMEYEGISEASTSGGGASSEASTSGPVIPFSVGENVNCNHEGTGIWFKGTIVGCLADGTYDVRLDSNNRRLDFPAIWLRRL